VSQNPKVTHPFVCRLALDTPGSIGANWWSESVVAASQQSRRNVLLVAGAVVATSAVGTLVFNMAKTRSTTPPPQEEQRKALQVQQELGWDFGDPEGTLTIPVKGRGVTPQDYDSLASDLAPVEAELAPFYVRTLFDALNARPTSGSASATEGASHRSLSSVIRSYMTLEMSNAFATGQELARRMHHIQNDVALILELPGPLSVALAAGLSSRFAPVFLFGNWPHPKGTVPAHLTLGAALQYQPQLRAPHTSYENRQPVFVLDQARQTPPTDALNQFDNRYAAPLPSPEAMLRLGIKHLVCVVESTARAQSQGELSELLRAMTAAGISVQFTSFSAFHRNPFSPSALKDLTENRERVLDRGPATDAGSDSSSSLGAIADASATKAPAAWEFRFGSVKDDELFERAYARCFPKKAKPQSVAGKPEAPLVLEDYEARAAMLPLPEAPQGRSGGQTVATPTIGMVPVLVAASGIVIGSRLYRGGSYDRNRSSGSWGGG
jgi:hypothetical protein